MSDESQSTITMEAAAQLNAAQVGATNLMWMTKIATAMQRDEVVFESPSEMEMFRDQITLVLAGLIMHDTSLMVSTLRDMGMAELADLVRDHPLFSGGEQGSVGEAVRQAIADGEEMNPRVLAFFDDFPDNLD
jgi:hypothetical protein